MRAFYNATILTMDDADTRHDDGVLVEDEGRIVALGPRELLEDYPQADRVDLGGRILMPGLVNAHVHLSQALLRGGADDMALVPWLTGRIWPFQAAHDTESFLAGARLAMLEMLCAGTTTFCESMVIHYGLEALCETVESVGMRAAIAKVVMRDTEGGMLPAKLRQPFDASLAEAVRARDARKPGGLVDVWLGPRWTGRFDDALLDLVREAMDAEDLCATIHYAESAEDTETIRAQTGREPIAYLAHKGLMARRTLIIHGTHLEPARAEHWQDARATLVHCPVSAMKVGMGYADIPGLAASGACVSLGTDAAACNNTHDLFREMRTASLLHKHQKEDPQVMPAAQCLAMATRNGAKSLYLDDRIGRLAVGLEADMITIETDAPHLQPLHDPAAALVYAANASDVRDVYVRGEQLVKEGQCLVLDAERVVYEARAAAKKVWDRAGL